MAQAKSEWQTKKLATAFLENVREAIPGAALQLSVIRNIVQHWKTEPFGMLDLGCGDGILGHSLLRAFPASQGVFVDFSEPMLEAAHENLKDVTRTSILKADFSTPLWMDSLEPYAPFDVVVSGFSIHHQPDKRKKELYGEIYSVLSPGGVFLNLEHVSSCTSSVERLYDEFFIDHLHEFHTKANPETLRETVAATYYNRADKKENVLAPLELQCEWLREIGFQDVDCFFKVFELGLFGGRKALEATV
jgi:ubiquinone/menaquinone biosynthesis C-methylase UbiE